MPVDPSGGGIGRDAGAGGTGACEVDGGPAGGRGAGAPMTGVPAAGVPGSGRRPAPAAGADGVPSGPDPA
ncbi:hypothetical protein [Actinomycetospora chiangmaiensis]|uniref:hypothetical protein n=1 Tax=Actinomycetospora chiangmaiensis TaxID=402650 RepID=UPI00037B3837|nr:hypothetical protein [Actinomycetospora chiangmaiensis]